MWTAVAKCRYLRCCSNSTARLPALGCSSGQGVSWSVVTRCRCCSLYWSSRPRMLRAAFGRGGGQGGSWPPVAGGRDMCLHRSATATAATRLLVVLATVTRLLVVLSTVTRLLVVLGCIRRGCSDVQPQFLECHFPKMFVSLQGEGGTLIRQVNNWPAIWIAKPIWFAFFEILEFQPEFFPSTTQDLACGIALCKSGPR